MKITIPVCLLGAALLIAQEWRYYGGDAHGTKYSSLTQINRKNVRNLKPVWVFDTGDFSDGANYPVRSAFETTPLVVDGVMYVPSSFHRLFALDAETGKVLWEFDPKYDRYTRVTLHFSRGVTYWTDGKRKRILMGDQMARLFSIDAVTGKLDPAFGNEGVIDMKKGVADKFPKTPYGLTSPSTVCRDTIVVGAAVSDGEPRGPAGDIRGLDVRTGALKWTFHTVPRPGEFGHETWAKDSWQDRSGANGWTIFSADEKLGNVYVPLTSPATDIYGGDRVGDNLFGDSLVALDCETGKRRWHFQTVHHNLWDYDLPAQPVLFTMKRNGRSIDAVAQITKTGFVFMFDRANGTPLHEIQEKPIPKSPIPGEQSAATQPIPVKPPPFARQSMRMADLTTVTPESRADCLERIKGANIDVDLYTPVTEQPTVFFPGTNGGANWGGGSYDPATGTLYVNSMDVAAFMRLVKRPGDSTIPYRAQGFGRFWDSNFYPCQQPPWGSLTAIDLNKGEFRWQVRLGEFEELTKRGVPKTGTPQPRRLHRHCGRAGVHRGDKRQQDPGIRQRHRRRVVGRATAGERPCDSHHVCRQVGTSVRGDRCRGREQVQHDVQRQAGGVCAAEVGRIAAADLCDTGAEDARGLQGRGEQLPVTVAAQPVPFSHKIHMSAGARCVDCHAGAATSARAGIPDSPQCMNCHRAVKRDSPQVAAIRRFSEQRQPIPWIRVYKTPDFVNFSHARHSRFGCTQCHGPVEQRDVLAKEVSTSMEACMSCHVQHKASTNCSVCHELGQ